jgi:hypothetical protein
MHAICQYRRASGDCNDAKTYFSNKGFGAFAAEIRIAGGIPVLLPESLSFSFCTVSLTIGEVAGPNAARRAASSE